MHRNVRRFVLAGLLVAGLEAAVPVLAAAPANVRLVDPRPQARLVNANTTLLLRFDRALTSADGLPTLRLTGERSGEHTGTLRLADGGRALVFRPATPFAPALPFAPPLRSPPPAAVVAFATKGSP